MAAPESCPRPSGHERGDKSRAFHQRRIHRRRRPQPPKSARETARYKAGRYPALVPVAIEQDGALLSEQSRNLLENHRITAGLDQVMNAFAGGQVLNGFHKILPCHVDGRSTELARQLQISFTKIADQDQTVK